MTATITLTATGLDTGPTFDLYSDLDGFTTPFESGVTKNDLLAGYTTTLVPDTTVTVRVQSIGDCVNYVDLPLAYPPTTTTTTVAPTTTTTTIAPTTTTTTTVLPVSDFSYVRDGSQDCTGFHLPYVEYYDEFGVEQTLNLAECSDVCATFPASSIKATFYAIEC